MRAHVVAFAFAAKNAVIARKIDYHCPVRPTREPDRIQLVGLQQKATNSMAFASPLVVTDGAKLP